MRNKIVPTLFLVLLGLRPFLSSLAFPKADIYYSAIFLVIASLTLRGRLRQVREHPSFLPLALFLAAILISMIFSQDLDKSLSKFYRYIVYLMAFFAVAVLDPKAQRRVVWVLAAGGFLVSFYALRWLIHGLAFTLDFVKSYAPHEVFAAEYLSRARAFVPFVSPNDLGGYLVMIVPLSFAFLRKYPRTKKGSFWSETHIRPVNLLPLFGAVATSVALLSTQSLGAVSSLMLALLVHVFRTSRRGNNRSLIGLLLFAAGILTVLVLLRSDNVHFSNHPLFSFFSRLGYWRRAVDNIQQHPFVGFGLGNYPGVRSVSPHNSYLQIWAETGVLGFIALLFLACQALRTGLRSGQAPSPDALFHALWIGNAAFLIHNLVDFTLFHPQVAMTWWCMAPLLINRDLPGKAAYQPK